MPTLKQLKFLLSRLDDKTFNPGARMPTLKQLKFLLSRLDDKTLALVRYLEYQIDFLEKRLVGRLLANEAEQAAFGRLATELGRPVLAQTFNLFHPETLFRWHRELVAKKFDSSQKRSSGRPSPWRILWNTVDGLARQNPGWGAHRMHGQLKDLGFTLSEPTVRRLMRRLGLDPAPKPNKPWSNFLERHRSTIVATDFFTYEIPTPQGPQTQYVLFFIQHDTRRVHVAGVTRHPTGKWMDQMASNLTMEDQPFFKGRRFLIMDRDTKYSASFRRILSEQGIHNLRLPWRSPNLNAFAERWVRTVKEECLNELLLLDPEDLMHALQQFLQHYHHERAHQGVGNKILFPTTKKPAVPQTPDKLQRKSRLGGLLNYYYWDEGNPGKIAA